MSQDCCSSRVCHKLRLARVSILMFSLALGSACSSPDLSGPVSHDLSQLPWTLSLSARAITMSIVPPYDTLQLTAVVRTAVGTPLTDVPVTFTSSDSSIRVSDAGLLTARRVGSGLKVIATSVVQGIRVSDTAMINVTAVTNPPIFGHVQLQVPPEDSTNWSRCSILGINFYGCPYEYTVQVGAQTAGGTPIANTLVTLSVSDLSQAGIDRGNIVDRVETRENTEYVYINETSRIWKPLTLYASATVYGVTLQDSLSITMIPEVLFVYTVKKKTLPGSSTPSYTMMPASPEVISVGGCVWWQNFTSQHDSLDIVFDDPTAAAPDLIDLNSGEGNIAAFPGATLSILKTFDFSSVRSRCFPRAGTFPFHSPRMDVSGTVVVQEKPQ